MSSCDSLSGVISTSSSSTCVLSNDSSNEINGNRNGSLTFVIPSRQSPPNSLKRSPSRRTSVSLRLAGVFSRRDKYRERVADAGPAAVMGKSKPNIPSNKSSILGSNLLNFPGKQDDMPSRRFIVHENGSHEHKLNNVKRQQRLRSILRNFWEKRRDSSNHSPDDHTTSLSLISYSVVQRRHETAKLTIPETKPSATQSILVQKYGKCQEIIGHGAFGVVRIAHKVDDNDPTREKLFAVKEFKWRSNRICEKSFQKQLASEFCLSSSMSHPNIIHTLDLLKDEKGDFCEVMEYCAGGDLFSLIISSGHLDEAEADCFFKQLMRGVEYMHEMGVAHRDLKPENLLLTEEGVLKITDFGSGECFRTAWEKDIHYASGLCGSAPYIAPEEFSRAHFDPRAVDIWACGIIYMAMRTGRHLWCVARIDEDEYYTQYVNDRREEAGFRPIEDLRKPKCQNVIYSTLDPNPKRRLTANQVLRSEWIRDCIVCKAGEGS